MHAPIALYRLRDRLALTRPELTALLAVTSLFACGLFVHYLPAPPVSLDAEVIRYQRQFVVASAAPDQSVALVADSVRAEARTSASSNHVRSGKASPQRPVGLNTATASQLETLPRVGPKMAQRILDYRAAHGGFRRVDDLRNVRGIGEKTLEQLRPLVTLN